jgi:uncharacterized membrane protein YbjE (DUF340 family)
VEFDPFIYVALAGGYGLGRVVAWRGKWLDRFTIATVAVLIFFLGGLLAPTPIPLLLEVIPRALLMVGLVLGFTVLIAWTFHRGARAPTANTPTVRWAGVLFLAPLLVGFAVGRAIALPYDALLTYALYALLVLIGFGLHLSRAALDRLLPTLLAVVAGAVLGGVLFSLLTATSLRLSLGSTLAFGWYSLAGPILATQLGAAAGFLAFLANFLRENLTMVSAPTVGPAAGPEVLTAMGGATAMDTTLYFVTRYGGEERASLALASGFILTVAASLLVPLALTLP